MRGLVASPSRLSVDLQPAQRVERRDRRVDDEVGGSVESDRQIFFVLVLPSEDAAHAAARHRSAATITTASDHQRARAPADAREPLRHSSNDILRILADYTLPHMSTSSPVPDRRQFADVSRVSRDARPGLTGPGGKTTHAVYIFVTMLRKLMQDHQPQYIAASFDLPGRRSARDGDRLQGQPRADAAGPRRADPVGARGVRGDGRADPDVASATRPTT